MTTKSILLAITLFVAPLCASANADLVERVVNGHVLPRFETLRQSTAQFSNTAAHTCDVSQPQLQADYHAAFDAWMNVSHLRFGPTETDDRAFALAFWPDKKGKTPKALRQLISQQDPAVSSAEAFSHVSIAARGFYAMEFLLFDPEIKALKGGEYQCKLMQTIARDIATTSAEIADDWQNDYAPLMIHAGQNTLYRSSQEATQDLFKAATTGLEFTIDARLRRPLGTFDKPRPKRAEARRSARSLRNVDLATRAATDLAMAMADGNPDILSRYTVLLDYFTSRVAKTDDPAFAGVANPQTRVKVEIIQQAVIALRDHTRTELGPYLGVSKGFSALDGD